MLKHILFYFLILSVGDAASAKNAPKFSLKESNLIEVPYIAGNKKSDRQLMLFLTFGCDFCYDSLKQLANYVQKHKNIGVRVFFFAQNKVDEEKIKYILACSDLNQLLQVYQLISKVKKPLADKKFNIFLAENKQLKNNIELQAKSAHLYEQKMKEEFFKNKVDKAPTWIVDEMVIEGFVEDFEKVVG